MAPPPGLPVVERGIVALVVHSDRQRRVDGHRLCRCGEPSPWPLGGLDALLQELLRSDRHIDRAQRSFSPRLPGMLVLLVGTYRNLRPCSPDCWVARREAIRLVGP